MSRIKCESCGSTRWQPSQLDNMLECQYCGAMQPQKGHNIQQTTQTKQGVGLFVIVLPLVVVFMLVIWWIVFVQFRDHPNNKEATKNQHQVIEKTAQQVAEKQSGKAGTYSQTQTEKKAAQNTPVSSHLNIINQKAGKTSIGGKFWIFEVQNLGDQAIAKPGVVVSGFDTNGQRLVEQSGWSHQDVLAPNESTALMVFLNEPPSDMVKTSFSLLGKEPQKYDFKQVSHKVLNYVVKQNNNRYEIVGDVLNDTDQTLSFSKIVVVAKNKSAQPVGIASGFATVKNLKPQETSGFKITVGTFLTETPDSWTLKALARPLN